MSLIKIVFSDLTHTGITVDTNYLPLGIGYVAAYAKKRFGNMIDIQLFKYPQDLSDYLTQNEVQVACFSNYSWNLQLSYQIATKIKTHCPDTVIVFGGPNFPNDYSAQEQFLTKFPNIDFYIAGEGEFAFAALLETLIAFKFDLDILKSSSPPLPGTYYLKNDVFFANEISPRISDLSQLPSPILTGLFDKFIEANFIPIIQTNRGCPYTCTYCHDGSSYYTTLRRFPKTIYERELHYLALRSKVPFLSVADLNFGIFKEDYETATYINKLTKEYNWPRTVDLTAPKNNKECVSDIVELLGSTYLMGASVQSTDESVLSKIKRKNLPLTDLVAMAKKSAQYGGNSFSEVILCLPGDSRKAYTKSLFDLLDAGINEIRSYQFIILDGTEAGSDEARFEFKYQTRWRVLPRCFGTYTFYGEKFHVAEYHEVCVSNSSMPHEDYLYCRKLGLIVEIFNNGKVFNELLDFLNSLGIRSSLIVERLLQSILTSGKALGTLLVDFEKDEMANFFTSKNEIETFLSFSSSVDQYISGKRGKNQMLYYRAIALIEHLNDCCNEIFGVARRILSEQNKLDELTDLFLKNLEQYVYDCRGNLFSTENFSKKYDFDFVEWKNEKFSASRPLAHHKSDGVFLEFGHDPEQLEEINALFSQFGKSVSGLGHLMQRANVLRLYRTPRYLNITETDK